MSEPSHHPHNLRRHPRRGHQSKQAGVAEMSKSKHGKIDGQFVYMLYATLDSPAYRATSHGAKALYLCLKRRVSRGRDTAYISFRIASRRS